MTVLDCERRVKFISFTTMFIVYVCARVYVCFILSSDVKSGLKVLSYVKAHLSVRSLFGTLEGSFFKFSILKKHIH